MRHYANVQTSVWAADSGFRGLPARAQWLYLLLLSQPNISAAGVLPLTVRRWAQMSANMTTAALGEILDELEAQRYVVVDHDTEELLVRTFVRWDNGYRNPKRRPVILRDASAVESLPIRLALVDEFVKLELPTDALPEKPSDSPSIAYPAPEKGLTVSTGDAPKSSQENSLFDTPSDGLPLSEGVVVTHRGIGTSTKIIPNSPSSSSGEDSPIDGEIVETENLPALPEPVTTQGVVGEWIAGCRKRPPGNVIGQISKQVKTLIEVDGVDPVDVRAGLDRWKSKNVHPSVLPSIVNEVMNATTSSTTDDRVAGWLAMELGAA